MAVFNVVSKTFLLAIAGFSLGACKGDDPETLKDVGLDVDPAIETSTTDSLFVEPAPSDEPPPVMRLLRSEQAPFACDLLEEEVIGEIFDEDVNIIDHTQDRQVRVPVESTCLLGLGEAASQDAVNIRMSYVRVDVYTDRSLQAREWGSLHDQWSYRLRGEQADVRLVEPGALAAWVDSDHPPDPALLVRMGDVMFEIGYWPPSSSPGSPETNRKIERLADVLVKKVNAHVDG